MSTWRFTKAEPRVQGAHIMLPLSEAMLCVDCETITDASGEVCPACDGRGGLVSLSRWLGGSVGPVERRTGQVSAVSDPAPDPGDLPQPVGLNEVEEDGL